MLVQAEIDDNPNVIWQNTLGSAVGRVSASMMNITTFGPAEQFDRAKFTGIKGGQPVYRNGGLAKLINGTGISWGRTAWANGNDENLDRSFAHEGTHYEQQNKIGFANFYGHTIKEYAHYFYTTGSNIGAYMNPGNLEYGTMQIEKTYGKLKDFLKWLVIE